MSSTLTPILTFPHQGGRDFCIFLYVTKEESIAKHDSIESYTTFRGDSRQNGQKLLDGVNHTG